VAVVVVGIGYGVYTWTRRGRGAFTRWGCAVGQPLRVRKRAREA
jgi:hypothetical protein